MHKSTLRGGEPFPRAYRRNARVVRLPCFFAPFCGQNSGRFDNPVMPAGSRRYLRKRACARDHSRHGSPQRFAMKKLFLLLAALATASFIFAADPVKPAAAAKPKAEAKCDD